MAFLPFWGIESDFFGGVKTWGWGYTYLGLIPPHTGQNGANCANLFGKTVKKSEKKLFYTPCSGYIWAYLVTRLLPVDVPSS